MARLTESELLARDEKKVAERKAKIGNRDARHRSKEVRDIERALWLMRKYQDKNSSLRDAVGAAELALDEARKAARS